MMRTYQTRLTLDEGSAGRLDSYAALFGKAERTLFAEAAKGGNLDQLKPGFSARFGLTARQFNALSRSVKGKIDSLVEVCKLRIADLQDHLSRLEKVIAKLPLGCFRRHQKKRKMASLQDTLAKLKQDQKDGIVRLCFGGRKLFHAQHHLEDNGYAGHEDWKQDWQDARSDECFVLGSKDETSGCQGCQLTPVGEGVYRVKLRLPNALVNPERPKDKHIEFKATFDHGQGEIDAALVAGTALSFRFLRDAKSQSGPRNSAGGVERGWRMLVSTDVQGGVPMDHRPGALGVDVNADHLALIEMNADGNPIRTFRIPLVTYGCSSEQAKARIGDAVKRVIDLAKTAGISIVIEKLDFTAKKRSMKDKGRRYARMLSSLAYNQILELVKARAFDAGIQVQEVNPAYTSAIGKQKFARRYGLSSHGAAALVIARRSLSFSERPNRTSCHGASPLPVWKRGQHVWKHWARVDSEERRSQRASGRREAIPGTPRARPARGARGTNLDAAGGIPARESVPSTVRGAFFSVPALGMSEEGRLAGGRKRAPKSNGNSGLK
jgi:IS605 OrfB family transposase